jgi:uncharacterized protein (DUF58 family)
MSEALLDGEMMRRLEQLTIVSRKISTGRLKGERRSRRRGSSNDFADYRNYVAGDDMRYLDWKIYSRLERLFIKLFLEEEDLRVYILVDASRSMAQGAPQKLLYAKRLAAALGYLSMASMDSVSAHAFGDGLTDSFGPRRGKVNAQRYFDFLQSVQVSQTTNLERSLKAFANQTTSPGIVMVISDFMDFEGYEQALRHLFGRNFEVLAVQVLSPQEISPEYQGDVRLLDCEIDVTTDISMGKSLMETYKRTLNTFCDELKNHVVSRGGSYMLTSTDSPFERIVLDVLRRKGVVR